MVYPKIGDAAFKQQLTFKMWNFCCSSINVFVLWLSGYVTEFYLVAAMQCSLVSGRHDKKLFVVFIFFKVRPPEARRHGHKLPEDITNIHKNTIV